MSHLAERQSVGASKCPADVSKHKVKRLKSRKERSQVRGTKDACKLKARSCHPHGNLDIGHPYGCCRHSCCRHGCRRDDASTPPPAPCEALAPTQEASVITEARLTGRRGLFNCKVKSIDIEQLLLGKREARVKETKAKATSSHVMTAASGLDEEAGATEEARDNNSPASDVTPDQREQQHPAKNDLRQGLPSSAECTPQRKNPPDPRPPSSPIRCRPVVVETKGDTHAQREDTGCKSVAVVARHLCEALRLPLMRKRDLVAESREVLVRALRAAHGQRLQQNLLRIHSTTDLHHHPRTEVQYPTRKDWDGRLMPDTFPAPFQVHSADYFYFGSKDASALENTRKGRQHVPWDLRSSPQQHFSQTDAWQSSPMNTSAGFLEDIFRPHVLPEEFSMDFGSSSTEIHHLFGPSPPCRAEPATHGFAKTDYTVGPFEDCFARRRLSRSQASSTQLGARQELAARYSPESFPLERETFESQQYFPSPILCSQPLTSIHDHRYQPSYSPPSLFASLSSPKPLSFYHRKLY
ncbi:uncharacterized protein si:dkey-250k15.4 isoform X2 [Syngnathus typhle]|nr:uncharacterized protein si:dkey-250k15.4 isoform X2 [Syngnathus typhle]XP_061146132.1 uncharacterized protein si:dkey-250k15.4 isoform X2 [Syngnathus typhle]